MSRYLPRWRSKRHVHFHGPVVGLQRRRAKLASVDKWMRHLAQIPLHRVHSHHGVRVVERLGVDGESAQVLAALAHVGEAAREVLRRVDNVSGVLPAADHSVGCSNRIETACQVTLGARRVRQMINWLQ